VPSAAAALAAAAAAAWWCAPARGRERLVAHALAALLALHLASAVLVTAAGAGPRAQALLSALWALVGVTALVGGLLRDLPAVRAGALGLVLVALGKVFLYDLATLTPMARVASFMALGLLLLAGAFTWQRLRRRPPTTDLRAALQ
jgi:uncharacterized membrane protein